MRILLSIVLAACLPAVAQTEQDVRLESLVAEAQKAQARSDYGVAADAYRQALAIRPDLAELWSNLGLMQYESHEYPQAEKAFRRALGMNTSLFVPNLFLGLDLLELKRPHDAVGYLLAAEKLNPHDTQVLLALGRAFHALFDPVQSRRWYQRAADVAPRNGEAWYGLGLAYFALAESATAKLTRAFPHSPYIAELSALARHSDATEPRPQESDLSVGHPASIPAIPTQAQLQQFASDAFFSGDFPAAALAADRLRKEYPNQAAGWYWAVRAYQQLGVAALMRAADVEPDSPRIHALLGDVYQQRKMFSEAEAEYSRLLTLAPNSIAGLAGLATAYLHDGHLAEAQATAQKALDRDPQDSEINLLMGEILVARHDYAEAEPYLEHSLHARPDLLPRVHALLGRVYARTGRSKEAINELNQGLASDEDGSVYYQLARLYQSLGDTKAAAAAFEKSQQIRSKREALAQETLSPEQ